MHDVITIGLPILAILAGILFARSDLKDLRSEIKNDLKDLRSEIKDLKSELKSDIRDVRRELAEFEQSTNKRFDELKDASHRDSLHILESMVALHERVAIVESKQKE